MAKSESQPIENNAIDSIPFTPLNQGFGNKAL
jgi:hypothetical protein